MEAGFLIKPKSMRSVYSLLFIFIFPFFVGGASAQTYYTITTIAGTGTYGYSGDGGLATNAKLKIPANVTTDKIGNIYISDYDANNIRKIDRATNIIYTIAGIDSSGYNGDGIPATSAKLNAPYGINFGIIGDDTAAIFICDAQNNRIRKISSLGIITTIAGTGVMGYSGDGSSAILAKLSNPAGIVADKQKNFYFTDASNYVIRKINAITGYISTIAGTGVAGYSGDGGPATAATMLPGGIQLDKHGNIYFCDTWNNVVRRIDSATGIITTVAGNGYLAGTLSGAFAGDSGLATTAELFYPTELQINDKGDLFICDQKNNRIRKVDGTTGIITTIAGTESQDFLVMVGLQLQQN